MNTTQVDALLRLALDEDLGTGDQTSLATIDAGQRSRAELLAKEPLVLSGLGAFARVFELLDPAVTVRPLLADGDEVAPRTVVATLEGPTRSLLAGERTALNVLQRLCGTATLARRFVRAVEGTGARIVDTRKTTPGMRLLQKEATLAGGAANHRFGLDSGVLIKDNHIAACGSLGEAVRRARARCPFLLKVEVEVAALAQLDEALGAGPDAILLDNMSTPDMAEAVRRVRASGRPILLEASGNMSLDRVPEVARTGVDVISVGALTHSAAAADLSLEIVG